MPESKASSLKGLLQELNDEVEEEKKSGLTDEQRKLDALAREILLLERDLTLPDRRISESARIDRLMNFIEEKDF